VDDPANTHYGAVGRIPNGTRRRSSRRRSPMSSAIVILRLTAVMHPDG
jgi:hypothetical protein